VVSVTEKEINSVKRNDLEYSSKSVISAFNKISSNLNVKKDLSNVVLIGTAKNRGDQNF
jgi:hypothetical protein